MNERNSELKRMKVLESFADIHHLPTEHDRSIAGKLSKYANKSTVNREEEVKAWEEQTAEEWRSQN